MIRHGETVGFSGFTPAGAPKAIPLALADVARTEHEAGREFQIAVLTGASTGPSLDGALAKAGAIRFRTPYQTNDDLRERINQGKTTFCDMHLSLMPQVTRYGFLGKVDWSVVEACDVTPEVLAKVSDSALDFSFFQPTSSFEQPRFSFSQQDSLAPVHVADLFGIVVTAAAARPLRLPPSWTLTSSI
jgi:Acetyl-CoA hydrolase/transferase N-terminal domain